LIDPQIPDLIVRRVLIPIGVKEAVSIAPGMSGARVFRCRLANEAQAALKQFPVGTKLARIQEVQRVIRHSRTSGFALVPEFYERSGQTCWECDGQFWELQQWLDGQPLNATQLDGSTLTQITRGAFVIASFHASVRSLGHARTPAPAVLARLNRVRELDQLLPQALRGTKGFEKSLTADEDSRQLALAIGDAARVLRWNWQEARAKITRSLAPWIEREMDLQYVLRDIHQDHILFHDHQPRGLIDFDAVRMDTPVTDLARWGGSFEHLCGADSAVKVNELWKAVLAGFQQASPFMDNGWTKDDVSLASSLCHATKWISLANWLTWVVCEQRSFPCGIRVVSARIRELVRSTDSTSLE
jgi:Ser/Thr protein kinase RdoA (MazF antagonist)